MKNTKELIMETAWKYFSQYGYAGTNLKEICKETGITKGPLYYYFKDKEDLYQQVILRELENTERRYTDIFTAESTVMEMLEKDMALCTLENPLIHHIENINADSLRANKTDDVSKKIYMLKHSAFAKAKNSGQLKDDADIDEMLNFLYVFTFGIRSVETRARTSKGLDFFEKNRDINLFLQIFKERYVK